MPFATVLIMDDDDEDMIKKMMDDTGVTSTQQLMYEMATAYRWMIATKKEANLVAKIDPAENTFVTFEHPGLNRVRPCVH